MPEVDAVADQVRKIIVDYFVDDKKVKLEDIVDTARLVDDLRADSLDGPQIAMDLEDHFGIELPNEDLEKLITVGDVINYVKTKVAAGPQQTKQ